jgi:palmitoyltransferase
MKCIALFLSSTFQLSWTALEAFCTPVFTSGPEKNGFNLGFIKNIQQVFGDNKKFWLIPIGSR